MFLDVFFETTLNRPVNMFDPGLQCHVVAFRSNPAMQPVTCGDLAESTTQGGCDRQQSKIRVLTDKHMDRMEHKRPGFQSHQSYLKQCRSDRFEDLRGFLPLLKLMN